LYFFKGWELISWPFLLLVSIEKSRLVTCFLNLLYFVWELGKAYRALTSEFRETKAQGSVQVEKNKTFFALSLC